EDHAILGVPAEGTPSVSYAEVPGTYADGEAYSLRKPTYTIGALGFGPLAAGEMISPRIAPQLVGLGLLQAISEDTLHGFAASNGGKLNMVWDSAAQRIAVGRFGWKANQPNLAQQSFGAFRGDIGNTSALYPTENCPPAQTACVAAPPSNSQPNLS